MLGEVTKRLDDSKILVVKEFYNLSCFMVAFSNVNSEETKIDNCKRFLVSHNNDFEDLHLLSLDGAHIRWEYHWEIFVKGLLGKINYITENDLSNFPIY